MGLSTFVHLSSLVPAFRCKYGARPVHNAFTVLSAAIRQPLCRIALLCLMAFVQIPAKAQSMQPSDVARHKIKGLLMGTLIGDALGGPIEFQGHAEIQATPNPPKYWTDTTEKINSEALQTASDRLYLRSYHHLLPFTQPYGCWSPNAPPGSLTDDSRHKMILLHALRKAWQKKQWPITPLQYAKAYREWPLTKVITTHNGYDTLCQQWLSETNKAINWMMGIRKIPDAYPVERLWNGYPTCYGQMALTPIAGIYPGQPEKAYLAAYNMAWYDIGFAKDMIAASVAGISVALTLDPNTLTHQQLWAKVFEAMQNTDPYQYGQVPWCTRAVQRWLDVSDLYVQQANQSPAKLFHLLDEEFMYTTKWEAQVPFLVVFSILKMCNYDPLAAMQLSIEWGNDHDTYPQFLGAFIGAIYGPDVFSQTMQKLVTERLLLDYNEDIDEWVTTLYNLQKMGSQKILFENGR